MLSYCRFFKKVIGIALALMFFHSTEAQINSKDSLLAVVGKETSDTGKILKLLMKYLNSGTIY